MRSRRALPGPRAAGPGLVFPVLAALAAAGCNTDARYTRIVDPDTGDSAAFVVTMDFTRASGLPAGFTAAGVARTYVFGHEIRLEATNLTRPRAGYYYALYLANPAANRFAEVGPLTTPPPEYASLRDADAQLIAPYVSELFITRGVVRKVDATIRYADYTEFWIALVPKANPPAGAPPAAAKAAIPAALRARSS